MRMSMRSVTVIAVAFLFLGVTQPVRAQNPELQQQVNSLFTLTKLTADGGEIVTAGSVLALQKDGLMMCGINAKVPLPNTYKSGNISYGLGAKLKWRIGEGVVQTELDVNSVPQRKFVAGEKVWIVGVGLQNDGVLLQFYSDPYDNLRYHGDLKISFPKGSPSTEDVLKSIAEVVTVDGTAQPVQSPTRPAPAAPPAPPQPAVSDLTPPPAPPDAPLAAPRTVALGQTKDEVVTILGQPQKVAKVGAKEIDYYSDMKVIFINGQVKDIQ